ncbi:transcriptional regulator, TetR family [Geodermatophilus dictyosporus]|uniref:Transcriptional regulator, TetR family n=1 Tax=Geodermatophilus dictyosporus TaxID=1523247 RepID=A0A1I5THI7_9ACTN|nr:TetR-like C-terminal domain-containing protein [Geodermatophilus dictyosporus]SFP82503.1 transcriptional regulator, TetR family [Geodermatophilus dictyosporus]
MTASYGAVSDVGDRRTQVVEVAARLLAEEGPHGLSLRRLATAAGGSTQLVYTLFGGKPGLADALYAEGFRRLGDAVRAALAADPAPAGDPERLVTSARTYRRFAVAEPSFFSVMFGPAVPGFTPGRATREAGRERSLGLVVDAARECLDAGTLRAGDAHALAQACWTVTHGVAALRHAGLLEGDADDLGDSLVRTVVDAHRP